MSRLRRMFDQLEVALDNDEETEAVFRQRPIAKVFGASMQISSAAEEIMTELLEFARTHGKSVLIEPERGMRFGLPRNEYDAIRSEGERLMKSLATRDAAVHGIRQMLEARDGFREDLLESVGKWVLDADRLPTKEEQKNVRTINASIDSLSASAALLSMHRAVQNPATRATLQKIAGFLEQHPDVASLGRSLTSGRSTVPKERILLTLDDLRAVLPLLDGLDGSHDAARGQLAMSEPTHPRMAQRRAAGPESS